MPIQNDANIDQLITEVSSLFKNKEQFNQPQPTTNPGFNYSDLDEVATVATSAPQAPIRGTFACSGVFGSGDARHAGVHNGVDLRTPGGSSVYPMLPGIVSSVGSSSKSGNYISISHNDGISTYYAHLGSVTVHKGDKVTKDTVIGTVGDSGNAAGTMPHVHFEVSENKKKINPAQYFTVPPYTNPSKNEKSWISDEHKTQARSFKINDHLRARRAEFTKNVDNLLKIAHTFNKLTR